MKNQHAATSIYKSIRTSKNNTISLTGNHLIYGKKNSGGKFTTMQVYCLIKLKSHI